MPPEESLLAAVTAAVRGDEPPPATAEVPEAIEPVAAAPAAAKPDLVGADPTLEVQPAAPATPQMDPDGRVRGPDGKFVAATPKPGEPAPVAPVAGAAPAAVPAVPKVLDPVNDPVPPTAKPETRERITTLAGMVKERDTQLETATTELTTARNDFQALMAPINEANVTFDQFKGTMELLRNLNSPHQHEQAQALTLLQAMTSQLADRLGHVLPGADPLAGQADLLAAVQAGKMPREYAEEVAKARRLTAATAQYQQQDTVRQQAIQAGQNAVREVEQGFAEIDPQYAAKIGIMAKDTAYVTQLRSMPPTQWAAAFSQKYRSIKVAAASAPAPAAGAAPAVGAPQPLRGKQPAGTTGKPPATMLEAVQGALRKQA